MLFSQKFQACWILSRKSKKLYLFNYTNAYKSKLNVIKMVNSFVQQSKNLEDLFFERKFLVREVLSESHETSFTPISEMVIGGRSRQYSGGYTSSLKLKVESIGKDKLPVKELCFDGISAVRAGDTISALMPVYHIERAYVGKQNIYHDGYRDIYFLRELKEQEKAIEIKILSDKSVLRTDRAVDYNQFKKSV